MERKITEFLIKWKNDPLKKPLLIYILKTIRNY